MFDNILMKFTATLSAAGLSQILPSQKQVIKLRKQRTASSMVFTHGKVCLLWRVDIADIVVVSFRAPVKQAIVMDAGWQGCSLGALDCGNVAAPQGEAALCNTC